MNKPDPFDIFFGIGITILVLSAIGALLYSSITRQEMVTQCIVATGKVSECATVLR